MHQFAQAMRWQGWLALALGVLAIVVLVWGVGRAVSVPSIAAAGAQGDSSRDREREARHAAAVGSALAQFEGRSLFSIPPPPPPPPVAIEDGQDRPTAPPPPSRYGGPPLTALFGGYAWFADGTRLAVGEEAGGVRLIEVRAPWEAVVVWREVKFTIPLFARDQLVFPGGASSTTAGDRAGEVPESDAATLREPTEATNDDA